MSEGIIFDIKRFAIHDGPGIRTTVFFKGCPLDCFWCHNPEGKLKEPEVIPRSLNKNRINPSAKEEIVGKKVSVDFVMKEIEKDNLFYDQSGGGVTFSGGEPLEQSEFLLSLAHECKRKVIHTALDTSGYGSTETFNSIINSVDLFLYDLKFMNDEDHIKHTGVSNKQILKNLTVLSKKRKKTVIRFAVVPGITDAEENIKQIAEFVSSLRTIRDIDLLPYHRSAMEKYRRMNQPDRITEIQPPSDESMEETKKVFESFKLRVIIGG